MESATTRMRQFGDLVESYRANRTDDTESEVDVRYYTEPSWLETERKQIFANQPILVGHASMIPEAGTHVAYDELDVPIVLIRGEDKVVRAFLNVCRHRGMRLVNDVGVQHRKAIVCPYHNWSYGLDGGLKKVPREHGFPHLDKSCRGLRELPTAVHQGLIWVHPNPAGVIDLRKFLGEIYPDFAAFDVGTHTFFKSSTTHLRCNWKLVIEAFQDSYHVTRLHRKSIGSLFKDAVANTERLGNHTRAVVARSNFDEAVQLPPNDWDPRRHVTFAYFIYPNTQVIMHPDYISFLTLFPKTTEETVAVHTCLVQEAPTTDAAREHWDRAFEIIDKSVFRAEDYFVCEKTQAGLQSGANQTLLSGGDEGGLRHFHDILADNTGMGDHRAFATYRE